MAHGTSSYTLMIYIFHIIVIAIPLLYYGFRGQNDKKINNFGYTYLSLLGGMALIFHGYWFVERFV